MAFCFITFNLSINSLLSLTSSQCNTEKKQESQDGLINRSATHHFLIFKITHLCSQGWGRGQGCAFLKCTQSISFVHTVFYDALLKWARKQTRLRKLLYILANQSEYKRSTHQLTFYLAYIIYFTIYLWVFGTKCLNSCCFFKNHCHSSAAVSVTLTNFAHPKYATTKCKQYVV